MLYIIFHIFWLLAAYCLKAYKLLPQSLQITPFCLLRFVSCEAVSCKLFDHFSLQFLKHFSPILGGFGGRIGVPGGVRGASWGVRGPKIDFSWIFSRFWEPLGHQFWTLRVIFWWFGRIGRLLCLHTYRPEASANFLIEDVRICTYIVVQMTSCLILVWNWF